MCNQERGRPFTLKNKRRNPSSSLGAPFLTTPDPPWPTCLSNSASPRERSLLVPEPRTNQGRWVFGNEFTDATSWRLPLQLTSMACGPPKVNSLHTCCTATGGRQTAGASGIPVFPSPRPLYCGLCTPFPQALTNKRMVSGAGRAVDSPVTEHHPGDGPAMKCFSNAEREAFGWWATGRNLLVGIAAQMKRLSGAGPWKARLLKKPQGWSLAEWRKIVTARLGGSKREARRGCGFQNCLNPSST